MGRRWNKYILVYLCRLATGVSHIVYLALFDEKDFNCVLEMRVVVRVAQEETRNFLLIISFPSLNGECVECDSFPSARKGRGAGKSPRESEGIFAHLQQLLPQRLPPPQQHRMSRRGRMSQRQPIPFPLQQESRSSKRMMLSHPQPPLPKKPFMICTSF